MSALELKFIQANGLRFAYFEEGTGPLVLMLHGFPDTPHTWDVVRPAVAAAGYRVVTPFTRGYAPTEIPKTESFDADTLGRDALALIEALGEKQAVLVGHDWGASAAYAAAGLAPEKLRFLVTVGIPHPAGTFPTPRLIWMVRHFLRLSRRGAAVGVRAEGLVYLDELVQRWSPGWRVPPGETDAAKASLSQPGSLEAALGYYRQGGIGLTEGHKKKVTVPAAVFAGTTDNVPVSTYEGPRSRFTAGYEVVAVPGGHFMHREHPEPFIRELLRVIR